MFGDCCGSACMFARKDFATEEAEPTTEDTDLTKSATDVPVLSTTSLSVEQHHYNMTTEIHGYVKGFRTMVQNGLRGPDWRKIQVSFEIAVEFVEFLNIDLADHGIYQIRSIMKCDGRIPHFIEVSVSNIDPKKPSVGGGPHTSSDNFSPSSFTSQEDMPQGKIFRVKHPQQHIRIQEVLLYRVCLLVDPRMIEETIQKTEFTLCVDIVHVERDGEDTVRSSAGERTMKFLIRQTGLHFHRPVLFGYTHFCQLSLTVHATLIALQEPYRKFKHEVRPATWKRDTVPRVVEMTCHSNMNLIIFGSGAMSPEMLERPTAESAQDLISGKKQITSMCRILIVALEALQAKYIELRHLTEEIYTVDVRNLIDCQLQLALCSSEIEAATDREGLVECGQKLITKMAGEIVRIWTNFVEAYVNCLRVSQYLMEFFRECQLRRLGEGVFLLDHHKSSLLSKSQSSVNLARHDAAWELLRKSKYYTELLSLPVACIETDGKPTDVPVIFEDRFYHNEPETFTENGDPCQPLPNSGKNGITLSDSVNDLQEKTTETELSSSLLGIIASDSVIEDKVRLKSVRKIDEAEVDLEPSDRRSSIIIVANEDVAGSFRPYNFYNTDLREFDKRWMNKECSLADMLSGDPQLSTSDFRPPEKMETFLVKDPNHTEEHTAFLSSRLNFKERCQTIFNGLLFSDYPLPNATHSCAKLACKKQPEAVHLIICVHGLEGTHEDMKLVRTYLERALPLHRLEFLMSHSVNGNTTYRNMQHLTEVFVLEIVDFLAGLEKVPEKISFIGHSLGALLVRAAIAHSSLEPYLPLMHTFLSFCGPHFGLINNPSKIVTTGLWFFLKWRKAESLTQLALRDDPDLRKTFIYGLSQRDKSYCFQYILLVASAQDHYAPYYSARLEPISVPPGNLNRMDGGRERDSGAVTIQNEMADAILQPIARNTRTKLIRYDIRVPFEGAGVPDNITGRLAHIAVIDSEIFLEKFMTVNIQYFV